MISLNRNMSPKLREELVHIVVTGLIRWKQPTIVSKKLNVSLESVYSIMRGMTHGTVGFAKVVYKGLKLPNHIQKELKGNKLQTRTFVEAYGLVGGTIVETSDDLQTKLEAATPKRKKRKTGGRIRRTMTPEIPMPIEEAIRLTEEKEEKRKEAQREYNKQYHQKKKASKLLDKMRANAREAKEEEERKVSAQAIIDGLEDVPTPEDTGDTMTISDVVYTKITSKRVKLDIDGLKLEMILAPGSSFLVKC